MAVVGALTPTRAIAANEKLRTAHIGIGGVDTRRLTRAIRQQGAPHVALAHDPEGRFDIEKLVARARAWRGLVGLDLAKDVTCAQSYRWDEKRWAWPEGYTRRNGPGLRVVAVDYGAKRTSCAAWRPSAVKSPCCLRPPPPRTCWR